MTLRLDRFMTLVYCVKAGTLNEQQLPILALTLTTRSKDLQKRVDTMKR